MSGIENLGIALIETNQAQKEVTANTAFGLLADKLTETADVACDDGSNSIDTEQFRRAAHLLLVAGALTDEFTVELPAVKGFAVVTNSTSYVATIVCADADVGASEGEIAGGATAFVYCTGAEIFSTGG